MSKNVAKSRRKRQAITEATTTTGKPGSTQAPSKLTTLGSSTQKSSTKQNTSTMKPTTQSTTTQRPTTQKPPMHSTTVLKQNTTTQTPATPKPTTSPSTVPPTTSPPTTPPPTASPSDFIKMIDVDSLNRYIYFVSADNIIYSRAVDLHINNTAVEEIVMATGNISGLAYDWIDYSNLYWCESDSGSLWVVNVKDFSSRQLASNIKDPSELLVMPHQRRLAMVSEKKKILTIDVAGTDLQAVINASSITSLTLDQHKQKFYWINGEDRAIYTAGFDGKNLGKVTDLTDVNTHNLVFYNNYLVWHYDSRGLSFVKSWSLEGAQRVAHGYFDVDFLLVDAKILDFEAQPPEPNDCVHENGGCEQICLTRHENGNVTTVCECGLGYVLAPDKKSCRTGLLTDNYLLISDWTNNHLYQMDLQTMALNAVPWVKEQIVVGVLIDSINNRLIWSVQEDSRIYSSYLNGSEEKVLYDLVYAFPQRFALDETTGDLYYTANNWTVIGVFTHAGHHVELRDMFGYYLDGIAVHPSEGWLYFSADYRDRSYIGRMDMDGSNHKMLIEGDETVRNPRGITIDHKSNKLYWVDIYYDTIWQCELTGEGCVILLKDDVAYARDITTDAEFLYSISWNRHHVTRVSISDNTTMELSGDYALGRLEAVAVYRSNSLNRQQVHDKCKKRNGLGDCSTICLPTNEGHGCACPNFEDLKDDRRTCSDVYQCDASFIQAGDENKVDAANVTFTEICLRYVGELCPYQCPQGFIPSLPDTTMNCTEDGWDKQSTQGLCVPHLCSATIPNGAIQSGCSLLPEDSCTYTCDNGFKPTSDSSLICTKDAVWNKKLDKLCTDVICSSTISNGNFYSGCSFKAGAMCKFSCDKFYMPTTQTSPTCQTDGSWSVNTSTLCTEMLCPENFGNGQVTEPCDRKVDTTCLFTCDATSTKNPEIQSLKCSSTGNWDLASKACQAKMCPDDIDKGVLQSGCDVRKGSVCSLTCNRGYKNTTSSVTCSDSYNWVPDMPCKEILCAADFGKGSILGQCDRKVDTTCQYQCKPKTEKNPNIPSLMCKPDGKWDNAENACRDLQCPPTVDNALPLKSCDLIIGSTCMIVCKKGYTNKTMSVTCSDSLSWQPDPACTEIIYAPKTPEKSTGQGAKIGIGIGVSVLVLVIIAVVIVFFLFRRRLGASRNPYTASYSNGGESGGGNVAIENPGYMMPTAEPKMEAHPNNNTYAEIDPSEMNPVGINPGIGDSGIVNPLYMQSNMEPMPEQGEVTAEDVVLTTDSWLDEQRRGPDNESMS